MSKLTVVAVLFAPLLAAAQEKARPAALKELAGTWIVAGSEAKGKKLTKDELPRQWTFTVEGKAVLLDRKTGSKSQYTFTIDPSKQPREIDLTYQGPASGLRNTKQFGIFKIENESLTINLSLPGTTAKDRPEEFSAEAGRSFLMRMERKKDN
jgi:uncharacterized protein (TIGR03067 family)